MRFNLRPLANIQERILRAFSPNQEYIVLGYSTNAKVTEYYIEWLERYPFLKKAVQEFVYQNKGFDLVPFVLPVMNSYEPFSGLIDAENKICKDYVQMIERHITNELDEIGDIAYTLEHVINSLNEGVRYMRYGAVLNPTRKQIKGRPLKYLNLLPFNLNPT